MKNLTANNSPNDIQFDVPTYSQFLDVTKSDWWQKRACGIVSLKMAMSYWSQSVPTCDELIDEGIDLGGYIFDNDIGWRHASLVELAKQYGFSGANYDWANEKPEAALRSVIKELAKGPIIASIYKNLDAKSSSHLVVITGINVEKDVVYYNDPHAKKRNNIKRTANIENFLRGWKQRIVVVRPNKVQ